MGIYVGDQKGLIYKRYIKYRPPAFQGGQDYAVNTLNRLDQADREMERMFGEDR